jgi:transposase
MTAIVHSRAELENLVVTRHQNGTSIRALARELGLGRNTIRKILRNHAARRDHGHDTVADRRPQGPRASKLDPFEPAIRELLKKYPDITGQRIYEELKELGYDGGITILRQRVRRLRPTPKKTPVVRFETEPGVQGQMDWSPYTFRFQDGGKTTVQCFSYILAFSRRQYVTFTRRRDFFTLIRRHIDAFEHFGGVPRHCLYDNEKTVVLRREAGQPVFNPRFIDFITYYQCRPVACLPRRAETKGKVERPFQYIESSLLGGRTFRDLDDLCAVTRWWLANRNDTRIHRTTRRPPLELFLEQEAGALQPLPAHPYDASEVALRVCSIDGYIEFATNRYPVPYEHVGDILTVKATEDEIFIYSPEIKLIATYQRLPAGANITVDNTEIHRPKSMRYGLEPVQEQFLALCQGNRQFLQGLLSKHPKNPGFHARAILQLKERYHSDDIAKAMEHACRYHAFDHMAVERILRARFQPRTLESCRNERAAARLRQSLPPINQRSLDEYADLFRRTDR